MSRDRGLTVEFLGLPAAGKTRLASEVKRELEGRSEAEFGGEKPDVETSTEKRERERGATTATRMALTQFLVAPSRPIRSANPLYKSDQKDATYVVRYLLYQLYICEELREARNRGEIYLSDQGFLQHLWRIQLTSGRETTDHLAALARIHYPLFDPEIAVFVDVDHRTRMERATGRGTDVDDELYDPEHPLIKDDIESYETMTEFVPEIADELNTTVRTLDVDNESENLEENVSRITDCVLSAWRSRT